MEKKEIFPTVGEEAQGSRGAMCVTSMCMNCEENGETRILLVKIPHFREIIVSSFSCEECGFKNQVVQFGGEYGTKGVEFSLKVMNEKDLNRQIVKSDYCTLVIPELGFTMPPKTQKGSLNTLEGVITRAIDGIKELQPLRKIQTPEMYQQLEEFIVKLHSLLRLDMKFTVILNDPSGNSNVENLCFPDSDPQLSVRYYERSGEENKHLGIGLTLEDDETDEAAVSKMKKEEEIEPKKEPEEAKKDGTEKEKKMSGLFLSDEEMKKMTTQGEEREVLIFKEDCYNCSRPGECRMIVTNIPHFKEIVLMAFNCDHCGFRTNEVKGGGSISPKGTKISLKCVMEEDLSRDLLKSESSSIDIPELDFSLMEGNPLAGRFTTIEGLLYRIKEKFENLVQFSIGDSAVEKPKEMEKEEEGKEKPQLKKETSDFSTFIKQIDDCMNMRREFTVIIDDPLSNSYIQNLYAPDPDPNMKVEEYVRSEEQNEDLGLLDMKVENYEKEEEKEEEEKKLGEKK